MIDAIYVILRVPCKCVTACYWRVYSISWKPDFKRPHSTQKSSTGHYKMDAVVEEKDPFPHLHHDRGGLMGLIRLSMFFPPSLQPSALTSAQVYSKEPHRLSWVEEGAWEWFCHLPESRTSTGVPTIPAGKSPRALSNQLVLDYSLHRQVKSLIACSSTEKWPDCDKGININFLTFRTLIFLPCWADQISSIPGFCVEPMTCHGCHDSCELLTCLTRQPWHEWWDTPEALEVFNTVSENSSISSGREAAEQKGVVYQ